MTAKKNVKGDDKPESLWAKLSQIDCTPHVEQKGKFDYLSWAWAWATLKEHCPDATFEKHWFDMGDPSYSLPYAMDKQGNAYVKVTVTVEGQSITETYPVTNHQHKSIQKPDSMDVNTALQRCLVKAIAFHGLAAYIYAGEDLPPDVVEQKIPTNEASEEPDAAVSDEELLIAAEERERAAILQFDGEKSKEVAEKEAKEEITEKSIEEWQEAFLKHPENPVKEKDGKTFVAHPENEDGYELIKKCYEFFMPRIEGARYGNDKKKVIEAIGDFWRTNKTNLEKMLKDNPEYHDAILAMFKDAKATANRGNIWRHTVDL
jgi:hypothetical protein